MQSDLEITNKLLFEIVKNLKQTNKKLVKTLVITIICFSVVIISGIVGFFMYESQFELSDEFSIEQEASGEEAEINNVMGNMYNDNATHNEGK